MQIHLIQNDGAGYAGDLTVNSGTTISALFRDRCGSQANPEDYHVLVNREAVKASYVLEAGDRVTFTPYKVEGA